MWQYNTKRKEKTYIPDTNLPAFIIMPYHMQKPVLRRASALLFFIGMGPQGTLYNCGARSAEQYIKFPLI